MNLQQNKHWAESCKESDPNTAEHSNEHQSTLDHSSTGGPSIVNQRVMRNKPAAFEVKDSEKFNRNIRINLA